jgi:MSHA biogenesis protein MshQ
MTTTATYDDVGAFMLQLEDATFAAADIGDGSSAAQRTIPSTPVAVGRFVPDRFRVSAASITPRSDSAACSGSSFTYMGERMSANFTLTAVNFPGGTTVRYTGTLGRLVLTSPSSFSFGAIDSAGPTVLGLRLDTSSSGTWSNGSAGVSAFVSVTRSATPDGPFDSFKLGVAPSDPDGVVLDAAALDLDADNNASNERAQIGAATKVRFGRVRLQNASGSPLIALQVPVEAQYWDAANKSFVTNTADSCTRLDGANIEMTGFQGNLGPIGSCRTRLTTNAGTLDAIVLAQGRASASLTAPTGGASGGVDLQLRLDASVPGGTHQTCVGATPTTVQVGGAPYLQGNWTGGVYNQNPVSRATFGIFKGVEAVIHIRESF